MPTYEYACTQCGQHVEVVQRISEAPLTACGVCGGKLRKVFHPAGILFKGSGFYSTDNRSSEKPASTETKGGPSPSPSSSGSSESGPSSKEPGPSSKATAASEKSA